MTIKIIHISQVHSRLWSIILPRHIINEPVGQPVLDTIPNVTTNRIRVTTTVNRTNWLLVRLAI